MVIAVKSHTRRKPGKPAAYLETHRRLKEDVEAMRRGELPMFPAQKTSFLARAVYSVADAIRSGIRGVTGHANSP